MTTRTLPPIVRHTDPRTSHQAAHADRDSLRTLVRTILTEHPEGLTDWETWELTQLGIEHKPSVVNRRRECGAVASGLERPSPSGRPCVVWQLPEAAA